jgi:hypothetical protein
LEGEKEKIEGKREEGLDDKRIKRRGGKGEKKN